MSTRATYRFETKAGVPAYNNVPPVTFYIHHDGYPEGAAFYFWQMHHADSKGGHFAARFLKGNEGAEFTAGHDAHGDTEYRYTLTGETLTAWKRYGYGDHETWQTFHVGPWFDFVNKYGRGSFDGFETLRVVPVCWFPEYNPRTQTLTRSQIVKRLEMERIRLFNYRAAHPTMTGNIDSCQRDADQYTHALADYDAQEAFDNAKPAKVAK